MEYIHTHTRQIAVLLAETMTNPQTWATHGYPISRQNHMVNSGWSWIDWQGMRYTQKSTYELGWPVNLFMVIFRTIYYWVCHIKECWFEKSKPVWKKHSSDLKAPGPFDPTPDYTHMVCLNMGQSHHWSCSPFQWSYLWVPCHMFGQPVSHGCLYIPFHCIIYDPSLIPLCIYNIWYPIVCPWCGWETPKKVAFWLPIANGIFRNMMDPFLLTTWLLFHA